MPFYMLHSNRSYRFASIAIAFIAVLSCHNTGNKPLLQTQSETLYKDSFPKPTGYVNDYALLYSPGQRDSLEHIIKEFENRTTMQIVIITFTPEMIVCDSLESVTKRIANVWGVGQKETNNGITIGIAPYCRRLTIRNGLGTEKIFSNVETQNIIDNHFIPEFKKTKYFQGTVSGLQALIIFLTKKLNPKNGI